MGWLLRVFGWLAAVLAVVVIAVRANFDDVRYSAIVWLATPNKPFVEASAFDYASADGWAALPGAEETAPVDVFVVPATLYFMPYKDSWNLRPDDAGSKAFLDRVLPGLRPLYKDCCKIYLAYTRMTTLGAFADTSGNGQKAFDLAYSDVERAFDHYVTHYNNGRPFILAGASQGSKYVFGLLKNRISGSELRKRMVAAYPLIWWMKKDQFAKDAPDIPVCSEPAQTGCVVTFNPVGPHLRRGLNPIFDQDGLICVNPLTWRTDGAYAGFDLNLGGRRFSAPDELIPHVADAQCDKTGRLLVSEIKADMYEGIPLALQMVMGVFGHDNHHSLAGGLFYANIKKNIQERASAYLAQSGGTSEQPVEP